MNLALSKIFQCWMNYHVFYTIWNSVIVSNILREIKFRSYFHKPSSICGYLNFVQPDHNLRKSSSYHNLANRYHMRKFLASLNDTFGKTNCNDPLTPSVCIKTAPELSDLALISFTWYGGFSPLLILW